MILTTCAACAAPLAHTAPRCIRCQTRYCNQTLLRKTGNNPEAKELLRARIPVAERSLGCEHYVYFRLRWLYAQSLVDAASTTTLDDLVQAEALLDDTYTRFRRVMGDGHPDTAKIHGCLLDWRRELARRTSSKA